MSLKHILSITAISTLALSAPAYAQTSADIPAQLRIQNDDCAFNACKFHEAATVEDAAAILSNAVSGRAAAMAARREGEGTQVTKPGRGLGIGQQNRDPQVVYLAFGSADPTFDVLNGGVFLFSLPDYIYSQSDRDFIQDRLEADYAHYNYEFTQTQPSLGDYSTLRIGDNDANPIDLAGGILFGRADNIDFGNDDRTDSAFVDASFWQLLAEFDVNFGTQNLSNFLNLPGPLDASGIEQFRQIAVVNQSANTASHELGHIQGLRHHDSFGAPGDGLPAARNPGEFFPVLETDQDALETLQHIMASGASAGLALNSPPFVDRFFSERSAVKLAVNERTRVISEDAAMINGGKLSLNKVVGSNPLLDGVNAGGKLDIRAGLVFGSISDFDEVDSYKIKGNAGDIFNAEVISNSDLNIENEILATLTLSKVEADGSLTDVAVNQRTFEGFEPLIFDYTLPESGDYILSVSSPDIVTLSSGTQLSLTAIGLAELRIGDYNLLAYTVDGAPGGGKGKGKNK